MSLFRETFLVLFYLFYINLFSVSVLTRVTTFPYSQECLTKDQSALHLYMVIAAYSAKKRYSTRINLGYKRCSEGSKLLG